MNRFPDAQGDPQALLAASERAFEPPDGAKQRVSQRLAASLLGLPIPTPTFSAGDRSSSSVPAALSGGPAARIVKLVAYGLITGALGGLGGYAALRGRGLQQAASSGQPPEPVARNVSIVVDEPPPASAHVASAEAPAPTFAVAPSHVRGSSARKPVENLDAERELLDLARLALTSGHPNEALESVSEHQRRFRDGVLAEEREALAINALVLSSRYGEARDRAERFLRRYPDSLLRSSVEAAVASIP
jgi:hypothetical protein